MSVYVKGMKNPESCFWCPLQNVDDGSCEIMREKADDEFEKPAWCPLVEVPIPHGRLIEEPKTLSYAGLDRISPYDGMGTAEYFCRQIRKQPTVIEAEEE